MNKKWIYIAGPLNTSGKMGDNIRRTIECADMILKSGAVPIVPHLFHFWDLISPKDEEDWLELDFELLDRCDALFRIAGNSNGADMEVHKALETGKPVFYTINDVWLWLTGKNKDGSAKKEPSDYDSRLQKNIDEVKKLERIVDSCSEILKANQAKGSK